MLQCLINVISYEAGTVEQWITCILQLESIGIRKTKLIY